MYFFSFFIILSIYKTSSRIADWQISSSSNMLLNRYATSFVGEMVAFVSKYPMSPRDNVI